MMKIKNSNGFIEQFEDLKMIEYITKKEDFKEELNKTKYLIVEGKDDVEVINSYLEHRGFYTKTSYPFQIITPTQYKLETNDMNVQVIKVDGKKSVLNIINQVIENEKKEQFCCLIDRDLDFILGENQVLENVFYYDFYELENYLLSEDVLIKILLAIKHKYSSIAELADVTLISNRIKELDNIFENYAFLNVLREFNFYGKLDSSYRKSSEELKKIIDLAAKDHVSKLNYYCQSLTLNESINQLFDEELKHCSLCMEELKKRHPEVVKVVTNHSILKELVDGKRLMNMFLISLKHVFLNNQKNEILDFSLRLKSEWIPCSSAEFKNKMMEIESYFNITSTAV